MVVVVVEVTAVVMAPGAKETMEGATSQAPSERQESQDGGTSAGPLCSCAKAMCILQHSLDRPGFASVGGLARAEMKQEGKAGHVHAMVSRASLVIYADNVPMFSL